MYFRIRRGLDLPITGLPQQGQAAEPSINRVALLGMDYVGMKPTMEVQVGDQVLRGQTLFTDKKTAGVRYTSPVAGRVVEINRGEKRAFQSVVIEAAGDGQFGFSNSFVNRDLSGATREAVRDLLVETGLWTALRRRPYSKVPALDEQPSSICVQAMDTNPLAVDAAQLIAQHPLDMRTGLQLLKKLTKGKVYCCTAPGTQVEGLAQGNSSIEGVELAVFEGPHPAGLPGTHIHLLDPVGLNKAVWYINYQDVLAIGRLFRTGELWTTRVISIAGPQVENPQLVRCPIGSSLEELTRGRLKPGDNRVISGSVLCGRASTGPTAYLGRYHQQVSVIAEGTQREFLGWQKPGFDKFSVKPIFASALAEGLRFAFTTNTNGSRRALIPIGAFEAVLPLDIEPTYLLRSLLTNDTEQAQLLGALELDEEDLALCSFVDPGKHEFGPILRQVLTTIEREG
jgi:Na+-transporting NADH:ubiquinone oxidoreductase subunit A